MVQDISDPMDRVCVGCGDTEDQARLEICPICRRLFCTDCAVRALGRRFCSTQCSHAYYSAGESDDDEDDLADE